MLRENYPIVLLIIVIALCVVAIFGLVIYSVFLRGPIGTGEVVEKDHAPAYITFIPIQSGKTTILMPITHTESWQLKLKQDGGSVASCEVTSQIYNSVDVGKLFDCEKQKAINK